MVYIPANFFAIYISKNKGLRFSLILGSICTALGGTFRILVILTSKFETAIIGSIFAAVGQAIFFASTSKLASHWFADNQRSLAIALASLSLSCGSILGFLLPVQFIDEQDTINRDLVIHRVNILIWIYFGISVFCCTLLGVFAKEDPPNPPSISRMKEI